MHLHSGKTTREMDQQAKKKNGLKQEKNTYWCECMNTWFYDAKEESNKAASMVKHCFKINTRLLQQTMPCFKINSRSSIASKQSVSKRSKALVID